MNQNVSTAPQPMSAAMVTGGRKLSDPQLSPDGSMVSVVTRGVTRNELALYPADGGPEVLLPLEPAIAGSRGGSHHWLPDGSGVVYIGVDGGIHAFDLDTSACATVVQPVGDVSSLAISANGDMVAYVIDLADVMVAPVDRSSSPLRVSSGADFALDPVFSVDGRFVAWHEWDVPNMPWDGSRIAVRDVAANEPVRIVAGGTDVAVQQPRFSPDGRHLSYVGDASGWMNLWRVDVDTWSIVEPVLSQESEHGDPTWGPGQSTYAWLGDGSTLAISCNKGGFGSFAIRQTSDGVALHDVDGACTNVHAVGNRVVALITDVARPVDLVAIDTDASGESGERVLASTAYAGVEAECVLPELVTWQSADGTEIPGRLYRTVATQDELPPLLLWMHGGPTGQSPATFFPRWKYFLDRGWSVLVVDYRGTTGWGRAFAQALRGRWGVVDVEDSAAAALAAIRNGWADPDRIVAIGGSSAGLTVLSLLARHPGLFAAGVAYYPVTDIFGCAEDIWRFEAHYFDSLVGTLPDSYDSYVDRSPITHAASIDAPVLLLHGDADDAVPHSQSIRMAAAMQAAGKTVEMHIYEGEGHGFRKPETLVDELTRVEAFVRHYVLHVAREGQDS